MGTEIAKSDGSTPAVTGGAPDWLREEMGAEYQQAIRENVEGESRAIPVVKIVHGNELFKLPDGQAVQSFNGVILFKHHPRTWWQDKEDKTKRPPDCASIDAKTGSRPRNEHMEFGECKTCIHSALKKRDDGKTAPSDCTERGRMVILTEGSILPWVMSASTKSLPVIRDYMVTLASRGLPYFCVVTKFELTHEERGEQQWSVLKLSNLGAIERGALASVKKMREAVEERARASGISDVVAEETEPEKTETAAQTPGKADEDF